MPLIVIDTGPIYSLAAEPRYSEAARTLWEGQQLWVPNSVVGEIAYRVENPHPEIPEELPKKALGLVYSGDWGIEIVEATDEETVDAVKLQARIEGPGASGKHLGECEGAALVAHRDPTATLLTDDKGAINVLYTYLREKTGKDGLKYQFTSAVLNELRAAGHIDEAAEAEIRASLIASMRPLVDW